MFSTSQAPARSRKVSLAAGIVGGLALISITGCRAGVIVPSADPKPVLHIESRDASAGLRIEYTVDDDIVLAREPGVPAVHILAFHTTLQNGFENAFKPKFTETLRNRGDFVIEISKAAPHFVADVDEAPGEGGAPAVRAVIEYEARMIAFRRVIGSTSGRAVSERAVTRIDAEGSVALGEAVADMYEQIVSQLFADLAAQQRRALGK